MNVYGNAVSDYFDQICNLFDPYTIDDSYYGEDGEIPGIKTEDNRWNIKGHSHRVVRIGNEELLAIASVYDDPSKYLETRLPRVYINELMEVLTKYSKINKRICDFGRNVYMSQMYDETNAQKAGFIERCTMFPDDLSKFVYSGPHISIGNPLFKTPRRVCKEKADFDRIYLDYIPEDYIQRTNYIVTHRTDDTIESQMTEWGTKYINEYRIATRKMLGLNQERTLMSAIIPPKTAHINGIFGMCFKESKDMIFVNGLMNSLPYDYFVRALGKSNFRNDTANMLPVPNSKYDAMIICRTMLLNCQTSFYKKLWEENYSPEFNNDRWLRKCKLLSRNVFVTLSHTLNTSLRLTDYERRELLLEIDVLVAKALGLELQHLITLYKVQFPVHKNYEENTWYDVEGKIVFTINKGQTGIGVDRKLWETVSKNADGFVEKEYQEDTTGKSENRVIKYYAPYSRTFREDDYCEVWEELERNI